MLAKVNYPHKLLNAQLQRAFHNKSCTRFYVKDGNAFVAVAHEDRGYCHCHKFLRESGRRNASDAMPHRAEINLNASNLVTDVAITAEKTSLIIDFVEDGADMAPDESSRAFEPFFTTKASKDNLQKVCCTTRTNTQLIQPNVTTSNQFSRG